VLAAERVSFAVWKKGDCGTILLRKPNLMRRGDGPRRWSLLELLMQVRLLLLLWKILVVGTSPEMCNDKTTLSADLKCGAD